MLLGLKAFNDITVTVIYIILTPFTPCFFLFRYLIYVSGCADRFAEFAL